MKVNRIVVGYLSENCYVLSVDDSKCLVIDPGDDAYKIIEEIGDKEVLGILITHRHNDHIGALEEIKNRYNAPIYEFETLEEKEYEVGPFTFDVIFNPGHAADAVSFYFKSFNIMFVGDFIFKESIGRCDLAGGNYQAMQKSIEKLKKNKEDIILYPGHGDKTSLSYEKEHNPYF